MKIRNVFAVLMLSIATTSCVQDEALNVEAAIDACTGKDIQQATIDSEHYTIQLYVSKAAELSAIHINFTLPEGATVSPATSRNGDNAPSYDFSDLTDNTRDFIVTSEDKNFQATYRVTLWQTEMPETYNFETLTSSNPYHIFYERESGSESSHIIRRLEWASGNPGFKLTSMARTPEEYPTVQVSGGHNGGYCLKLETKDTGSFGSMVKMPIAAGNLFIGSFDLANALTNTMAATRFGFPYFRYPQKLEGWYKFRAGSVFTSNGETVEDKTDHCDIYGVLYETDDEVETLFGDNSLTSDHIVMLARQGVSKATPEGDGSFLPETDEWSKFEFEFIGQNGKTIDASKLRQGKYKLAIVFSSSVDGAQFDGAVGSTLCVDDVRLTASDSPTE